VARYNPPKVIPRNIQKLELLKGAGLTRWTLDGVSLNQFWHLAQINGRATGQALRRMPE
jgi:hypothetical protein